MWSMVQAAELCPHGFIDEIVNAHESRPIVRNETLADVSKVQIPNVSNVILAVHLLPTGIFLKQSDVRKHSHQKCKINNGI